MSKVDENQAKEAWERIEKGESTVGKESRALGFHYNGPLRKACIAVVGRDKYFEVINRTGKKRGCNPIPTGEAKEIDLRKALSSLAPKNGTQRREL